MDASDTPAPVRTTETSLLIVDLLAERQTAGVEEIAAELDVAASTAHRHLQTLCKYGYAVNEGGLYRLGLQFLTIGGVVQNRVPEYALAEDVVQELAEQTGERAQFMVEEQGERIFLYTEAGEHAVKAQAQLGRRGPLHCSAVGKAILADLPEDYIWQIIDEHGLPRITENTITDPDELFDELDRIREMGVAFNREESTEGLHAVGASVKKPNGTVLGGLSVSGPTHRLSGERFKEDIPNLVRGFTQELELNIKYSQ